MFLIQQFVSAGHSNSRKVNKINGTKKHQFCCVLQTSLDTKVHMTTKTHSEHSFSLSSMLLSKVTSVKLAEEIKQVFTRYRSNKCISKCFHTHRPQGRHRPASTLESRNETTAKQRLRLKLIHKAAFISPLRFR